jgi:hypothetical protein
MRFIYLALGGLLILLVPACSSSSHAADPPHASTTVPADPYAVPPVISVAYVNSVLEALNHVYGNAERIEKQNSAVTTSVITDLRSIYVEPQLDAEIQIFHQALGGSLSQIRQDPGDRVFDVSALRSQSPRCIAATAEASYAGVDVSSSSAQVVSIVLRANTVSSQGKSLNPTPWMISYEEQRPSVQTCAA